MTVEIGRWPGRAAALGCAVVLALMVLLSHPVAEIGIVDDWSYAYSAKVLAETGKVVYNGWATAMLTWMLYLGAFFIRLFGFSFLAVRCSMLLVSMATVIVTHRLLRRSGLSETHSTVGTLAIMVSPPFFSLCFLYMSDIPGMLALVICFYAVVRALTSETKQAATGWLLFAAVSNLLVGSVRQIALLGVLVLVPCAALELRRRVNLAVLAPVWVACVACIAGLLHWFGTQPYSVTEPLLAGHHILRRYDLLWRVPAAYIGYLAPLFVLFVTSLRWRDRRLKLGGAAFAAALAVVFYGLLHVKTSSPLLIPYLDDTIRPAGFHDLQTTLGTSPELVGMGLRAAIGCLTLILLCGFGLYVAKPNLRSGGGGAANGHIQMGRLARVFVPFLLVYAGLFVTRAVPFDRYLLPLAPLLVVAVLYVFERGTGKEASLLWTGVLALALASLDVMLLHDEFALYRAHANAAAALVASGVPRTHIFGGFEYDGWTEIEATGYVKDPKLKLNAGQQKFDKTLTWLPFHTILFGHGYTPSIQLDYVITHTLLPDTEKAGVPDATYRTWTRSGDWTVLAAKVKPSASPRDPARDVVR